MSTADNLTSSLLATKLGELADDTLITIIVLKSKDNANDMLPFLHAHALELSAKAVCLKLNLNYKKLRDGHDLISIYKLIASKLPEINNYLPSEEDFKNYEKVWIPSETVLQRNISLNELPAPDELYKWELAFYIKNVKHLKYTIDWSDVHLSVFTIAYDRLNPDFLNLFALCRHIYCVNKSNDKLKNKIFTLCGETEGSRILVDKLINKEHNHNGKVIFNL